MAIERTLSIIKPDGVEKNIIGEVYSRFEHAGLKIIAAKMVHLSQQEAGSFYSVHREKPFYNQLIEFMSSGPIMVQVLEGEDAIKKNRELMGATNPTKADPGTIRYDFARNNPSDELHKNIAHGSDSTENAATEIDFFFQAHEIHAR